RLSFDQPSQEVIKPLVDVVNVEGRDSHKSSLSPTYGWRSSIYRPGKLGSSSALLARRERTDRKVIPVRISERELLGLSVRIYVWLLFELSDERACPLKRHVEIIDTEEQQEPVAGQTVVGTHQ